MAYLDKKQLRLIESWLKLAQQPSADPYTRFIALWVGFNAYCYGHYADDAQRYRADLRKSDGLASINADLQTVEAQVRRNEHRIVVEIHTPTILRIHIAERYTEDHIYASFAERHSTL